jgi:hypothetical protein
MWLPFNEQVQIVRMTPTYTAAVAAANTPPTNHAAGRHRRERSRPVGKSRNRKAAQAGGIGHVQLDSHMTARAAGQDPGATIRACSPYAVAKVLSPSAEPATRASQPIRLSAAGKR